MPWVLVMFGTCVDDVATTQQKVLVLMLIRNKQLINEYCSPSRDVVLTFQVD